MAASNCCFFLPIRRTERIIHIRDVRLIGLQPAAGGLGQADVKNQSVIAGTGLLDKTKPDQLINPGGDRGFSEFHLLIDLCDGSLSQPGNRVDIVKLVDGESSKAGARSYMLLFFLRIGRGYQQTRLIFFP
jgi:hypothetical protein